MKAIQVSQFGGPEVLEYVTLPDPEPGPGEALVDMKAIGVNFRDVTMRANIFPAALMGRPAPLLPDIPGGEGSGVVTKLGKGVSEVSVGDLVAFYHPEGSTYAEKAVVPSWRLVRLPGSLDAEIGATVILQGMTAHFLSHTTYPLKTGDVALVHAAAGGVGLLLVQMAKERGAKVIGTVSTESKAELARKAGADHTIIYTKEDFSKEVDRITKGKGVQVVYDAVGRATFEKSISSLAKRGHMVMYGSASGPILEVPGTVFTNGSIFLTRASLADYTATRKETLFRTDAIFSAISAGKLQLRIHGKFPLKNASDAHRQLENRQTTGKLLLIP